MQPWPMPATIANREVSLSTGNVSVTRTDVELNLEWIGPSFKVGKSIEERELGE